MSRRPAKARAAIGRTSAFGAFSSPATSTGSLSYLSEPPDLSSISDPNVVVSFKNLLKKDGTTKSKALEDLISYVEAHPFDREGGTEEPVLEAWVQLYPRISIDNSRRVRELSHTLQLELMKSARKRMERHIPKIVSTWLAGTFDRDRVVARNATEGLSSFLTTPEKVTQFWKRCQPQILEYATSAILETSETLSDERSTNADDAEAKYHRVLGGSLALVLNLLQKLDKAELEKHRDSYDQFFEEEKVWAAATVSEPAVRKLSCQLLLVCLEKRAESVGSDLRRLSKIYIGEGLKSNQTGSAMDFVQTLTALTERYPTIWTSDYSGKRTAISRLKLLLEKGSQGSNAVFWESLSQLLKVLPAEVIPVDVEGLLEIMKSMRSGVTSREEPRSNAIGSWTCYMSTAEYFLQIIKTDDSLVNFVQDAIFPLTQQFLFPVPEQSAWASGSLPRILVGSYKSTATASSAAVVDATGNEWNRMKEEFKTRIKSSLPEASKDHEKSQKAIADEASRWFNLAGRILEAIATEKERQVPDFLTTPSVELLLESLKLLKTRNWKPFGAAGTLVAAFKNCPVLFKGSNPAAIEVLELFTVSIIEDQATILLSPSAPFVLSSINALGDIPERREEFERIWTASTNAILSSKGNDEVLPALTNLVSSKASASLARQNSNLQTEIVRICLGSATGIYEPAWPLFSAAINIDALDKTSVETLAKELTARLSSQSEETDSGVPKALLLIAQKKPDLLLQDEVTHTALMTSLLSLSERANASPEVASLRAQLEHPSAGTSNLLGIIQQNINDVGSNSLAVETLVQQALQVQRAQKVSPESDFTAASLLPDLELWSKELSVFLDSPPDPSLSVTSSMGSAYFLVSGHSQVSKPDLKRDQSGCSVPGRMAMYTSKLLSSGFELDSVHMVQQAQLIVALSLTAEVVADQMTNMSIGKVWATLSSDEALADSSSLVSSSRKVISTITEDAGGWRDGAETDHSRLVFGVIQILLESSKTLTPAGVYSARVLSDLLQSLTEKHGFPSSAEAWLAGLDVLKSGPTTVLPAIALLTGLGETLSGGKLASNFCNRLVSDVAGAKVESEKSLVTLALLNACMPIYELGELPVANNRLVFAVRQITSWLETPENLDYKFAAEACKSLRYLLPCVKEVYGSYWERAVEFCIYVWTNSSDSLDHRLPSIHASLRVITTLQAIEEPNDDLVEVLQSTEEQRSLALLELLKLPRDKETQPLEIVHSIICRQVEKMPIGHVGDLSELYGLVAAESRTIQTAAFTVLHKALPAAQEQLSLDILLDKKTARLPDELLSLLLEAPTLDAYSDEVLSRFPTPIRSYLLSWHLVFDAFEAAAFKVRSDYAENLKAANYIGPLMDFTFDVLGHSAAHGLNINKANFTTEHIRSYDLKIADAESDERNMQWLLIHLYYLTLKHVPGLFKAWFIECRSKQTKIAVESWMTKYFSPIIISEALEDVAKWAETQEPPADDEKELVVKVSRAAKEVTAGYEVDELQASIAIRVPPAYPLEVVSVVGINRVAVNEKKWQSWIMTTQGVITFSGGSIIDGLSAFRRNVVGALKGQTECAICYSIISSDKKMPDKRCQTCKNLFHRTCLYKWFQSSNQNTCPLCRNPIDYLGADTKARRA